MLKIPASRPPLFVRLARALLAASFLIVALVFLLLRFWLLPNIESYHRQIAAAASRAIGEKVEIARIDADWQGIYPHLALHGIKVYDSQGNEALAFDRIDNTLSWMSLPTFEIRFRSLEIDQPKLGVRRDDKGVIYVAGIPVNAQKAPSKLSDWLLHQSSVTIKNGTIIWEDAGAPPLILDQVNFTLQNSLNNHRFGLKGVPPAELSSPIDVRGDLDGASLNNLQAWRGKLYGKLDYADTLAWKTWIRLPRQLQSGKGSLRFWFDFEQGNPVQLTADLHLYHVRAQLSPSLAPLAMKDMHGRISWSRLVNGFSLETKGLSLSTEDALVIKPTDFLLKYVKDGSEGEVRANSLDLGKLNQISAHFPLPPELRKKLAQYSPQGKLRDFQAVWGEKEKSLFHFPWSLAAQTNPAEKWRSPEHYSVKGRLEYIGISLPGSRLSGLSGNLDGNETGGSFNIDSHDSSMERPQLFPEALKLEALTAQGSWHIDKGNLFLTLSNASFVNADLSGNAYGSYLAGSGEIDLTASLTRAEAKSVWRYLPLNIGLPTRAWVKEGVLGGKSDDVRLRLKGNLADFPFADGKKGIFQVAAKIKNGNLSYANGWPAIDAITANLLFSGNKMEIDSESATIYGARLSRVKVQIPDLGSKDEMLQVEGNATGATSEFLKYIDNSPVSGYINDMSQGMQATGRGELKLSLHIPLEHIRDIKLDGHYKFDNNLISGPDIPDLEQVNALLDFSESAVSLQNANALILGGPARINAATQKDGTLRISLAGRANPDNQLHAVPWTNYLHGKTDWRGQIVVKKRQSDILLESTLLGLSSDLPSPLAKATNDVTPLRYEKKSIDAGRDLITVSYGKTLMAQLLKTENRIERGAIALNSDSLPALPQTPGIQVGGTLSSLNVDDWHDLLQQPGQSGKSSFAMTALDLKIGSLTWFGKHFDEMKISAREQEGSWKGSIFSREIQGDVEWRPEGKGRVIARLKNLVIPASMHKKMAELTAASTTSAPVADRDLPALDIVADNFMANGIALGQMELKAVQQGDDWKIDRLRINNPESNFVADGLWQGWARLPRTQIKLKLEISDIGKFLARMGYPEGVKRGSGKLAGNVSWGGSPQELDYPSLTGYLELNAEKGQFNKIEPGIGKLLGILSLQALPRRITLDFRDIFSEGFAFDEISGKFRIRNGIADTTDLRINGPAAEVRMKGIIDLGRETQNLHVTVAPQFGGSIGVAGGLIGGPVVGIATWVVNKLLQNPLDRITSYEYNVSGSWTEPNVSKETPKK